MMISTQNKFFQTFLNCAVAPAFLAFLAGYFTDVYFVFIIYASIFIPLSFYLLKKSGIDFQKKSVSVLWIIYLVYGWLAHIWGLTDFFWLVTGTLYPDKINTLLFLVPAATIPLGTLVLWISARAGTKAIPAL